MLTVKTYLSPAGEKGIGLFAAEPIPKGKVWWTDNRAFNKIISKEEVDSYSPLAREFLDTYASLKSDGGYYLCVDNARFQNHSDNPNTCPEHDDAMSTESCDWIASKDIAVGEELTSDYRKFCLLCKDGLCFENKEARA